MLHENLNLYIIIILQIHSKNINLFDFNFGIFKYYKNLDAKLVSAILNGF